MTPQIAADIFRFRCSGFGVEDACPNEGKTMVHGRVLCSDCEARYDAIEHVHLRPDPADPNHDIAYTCNAAVCWYMGRTKDRMAAWR